MSDLKVTIPPKTLAKILLRGIVNLSFIEDLKLASASCEIGERCGIKTTDGIVAYAHKKSDLEIVVISAYHQKKAEEDIALRAVSIVGILTKMLIK